MTKPWRGRGFLIQSMLGALLCTLLAWYGTSHPFGNWDLVGYTATAYSYQDPDPAAVHERTWASLARAMPPDILERLRSGSDYKQTVASSPEALGQQIPFYKPRVLFTALTGLLHATTGIEIPLAAVAVSAICTGLLMIVLYGFLSRRFNPVASLVLVLLLSAFFKFGLLARAGSPDTLASVLGLLTVLAFCQRRYPAFLACSVLLILARHETLVLVTLLCLSGGFGWRKSLLAAALAVLTFAGLYHFSHWYGWGVLFMHTFVAPFPYPAQAVTPVPVLWAAYLHQWSVLLNDLVTEFGNPLPIGALVALAVLWRRPDLVDSRVCLALSLSMLVKLALFPAVEGHWFRLYLIEILSVLVLILDGACRWRSPALRAPGERPHDPVQNSGA